MQNRRVQATVAHAYETVPYYREIMDQTGLRPADFHTAEDLAQLPLLTSKQVAQTPERFVSRRYIRGLGLQMYSSGTSRATVLLNYRLGDVATWSTTVCPCGRTLPVLQRIEGRSDDRVLLPDGRSLHALTVLESLDGLPGLVQVQLVQEELQRFVLWAVCTKETAWEPMRQQLAAALQPVLGQDSVLVIEQVEEIPSGLGGKVKAVISHCCL